MKKFIPLFLIATSIFANDEYDKLPAAYNAPYKNKNFFISGSFILWQPKEQGLDIATIVHQTDQIENPSSITSIDYDYDPGFKVALGADFKKDNWNMWLEYLYFHTKNNVKKDVDISIFTIENHWTMRDQDPDVSYIKASWELSMNILNLYMGRSYYVGQKLIFYPFLGIKGGWIDQDLKENYNTDIEYTKVKASSDSWLLGPFMGIYTKWKMNKGFRIEGDIIGNIFYQHFKLKAKEYDINPLNVTTNAKDDKGMINPNLDLLIGCGFEKGFNRCKIDLLFGYELNIFWNQNQMRTFVESLKNTSHAKAGNFTPHGFLIKAKLDF